MPIDASHWSDVEVLIRDLLEMARGHLSQSTVEAVEHYLAHAEYEMALEGLLLEIMEVRPKGHPVDWSAYEGIAHRLGLDMDSTFDGAFWDRLSGRPLQEKGRPTRRHCNRGSDLV